MKHKWNGLFFIIVTMLLCQAVIPLTGHTEDGRQAREEYVLDSNPPAKTFPIMQPDDQTIQTWRERHEKAPRAYIDKRYTQRKKYASAAIADHVSSANLLGYLSYSPSDNQGNCGNCWAWAGTRLMGIDLNMQKGLGANLSVQYINSCSGEKACCGGWLSDLVDFYASALKAIPTSNTNAAFMDGSKDCSYFGNASNVSCGNISTSTSYAIASIADAAIDTTGVSQDTAISNIKNILNQGKAVWMAYFLPTNTAWNNFYNFWNNQSESAVWDPDTYCGQSWSNIGGGGHAVTLVGYDDSSSSTDDHYWIALNSWGTTANRPNGLYRIKMYTHYDCTFSGLSAYAQYFQTLNISWNISSSDTTSPTVTAFTLPETSSSLTVSVSSFTATDNVGVTGYMITNTLAAPDASTSGWSTGAPASYTFSSSTTSGTYTLYAWAKDAAGNVSSPQSASVTLSLGGGADLAVSAASNTAKTVTAYKRLFTITDTTKNQGNVSAGASTTRYYLSTTTSKTGSSVLLSGTRSVPSLSAGGSSTGSVTVRVPSGLARASYYVLACADDATVVSESNESNNCTVSSAKITVNR